MQNRQQNRRKRILQMSAETKTAEKRKQRLLPLFVISHRKLQGYCLFQIEVNWSCHNHPVLHKDMPTKYQQNLISNKLLIFEIQLPPSQNPVIDFSTPARDLKDSFQEVTVPQLMLKIVAQTPQQKYSPNQNPQLMLKIVAQTPQQKYSPNQNLTSYPTFPNPPPNSYVIVILKYCHKNISVCYSCSGCFRENGYPIPPNCMIVVSKTQRPYMDRKTHQKAISTYFSNVYYHFHKACFSRHNVLFTPQLLMLLPDIKPFLLPEQILCLQSCGINI